MIHRTFLAWIAAAVVVASGCNRVPLTPPSVPTPTWQGVFDGLAVGVDSTWSVAMGVDTLADERQHWGQWVSEGGEVWEVRLHVETPGTMEWSEGEWPWVNGEGVGLWEGEAYVWHDGSWTVQGEALDEDENEVDFEWLASDTLTVEGADDYGCEQSLTVKLYPRSDCQSEWLNEPFGLTWDGDDVRAIPPGDAAGAGWVWTVDGEEPVTTFTQEGPGSQDGHFHLPDGWHEGSIVLTPLDPEGAYGGFWMERVLDLGGGGSGWECGALMFELERESAPSVWVEVRHQDKDGVWWSSARACDDVPEGPWIFEVTTVQDLGTVQGWDVVELSCDLALPMAPSNQGQSWASFDVAGLTVTVPR